MGAFLILQSGDAKGQRFDLDDNEITLGRAPDNTIRIPSSAISSHHLKVMREGKRFTVVDMDSTNGTGLNGVAIQQARLKPKDVLSVGGIELLFDGDDVEVDSDFADAAIGPSNTVRLTTVVPSVVSAPPPSFSTRKDRKYLWLKLIAAISLVALTILVWFMFRLFKAGSG